MKSAVGAAWRGATVWAALALLAVMVSGCGTPGPDGPADSFGLDLSVPNPQQQSGAIVFIIDGVNAGVFEQMLQAGQLPAFQKYFVDRGLYVPRAVANVPSVTLANLTSLACGQFPGHHEVTGVNWFDRNQLIWRNYETIAQKNTLDGDHLAPYVYSRFGDRTTVSIFFQPNRGTTKFFENWTSAGPPFYFGWFHFVDRLTLFRLGEMAEIARTRGEWPAVTYVYLLAPDFEGYAHGVDTDKYRDAIAHADRQIGRVLGDLERAGLLDRLVIAVASDHGLVHVRRHLDLATYLRKDLHLPLASKRLWEKTPFEDRLEYYRKFPAVLYGSGERYVALCLRKPIYDDQGKLTGYESWPIRPDANDLRNYPTRPGLRVDLVAQLAKLPAVRAVAYRRGGGIHLAVGDGEVSFAPDFGRDGPIRYTVVRGEDPMGWGIPSGTSLKSRQWLDRTADTDWPDLPPQLVAYFRSRRAGNVVIFAGGDWDLGTYLKAGHGGLDPQDMLTPMLLAGPGVPHARLAHARTVDLVPTLLGLLDRPRLYSDGMNIIPQAQAAASTASSQPSAPATQPCAAGAGEGAR